MASIFRSRVTLVWFVLVLATLLQFVMGHGIGFDDKRHIGVAIIVVAFVKVRYVILDFMEIRNAPLFMRGIAATWLIVVCSALVVLYWHGGAK